jgi:glycosyltransferase involved in cell wall biosynthesis
LRILYLANKPIPSRTAATVHIMKMCSAFAENGHHVELVVPDYRDTEPGVTDPFGFYGVTRSFSIRKVPRKKRKRRFGWFGRSGSLPELRGFRPNVVYARCHCLGTYSLERIGHPLILESHVLTRERNAFQKVIESPSFLYLVVISNALRDDYVTEYSIAPERVRVVHDGADEPRSATSPVLGDAKRFRVGYIGHLYQGRGIERIVELADRCAWADFHVVGGMEEDVRFWREEAGTRSSANLFFHGFVAPAQTESFRQSCDVLIAPYQEGLNNVDSALDTTRWMSPLKIFEYMASGKPIIASDLPALREILIAEVTGLLCPADSVQSWVSALERLRDDPPLREKLGQNARAELAASHTWKMRARQVLSGLELP